MKFSDMMGKGDRERGTDVAEPELPAEAHTAPPVPEAPIRFGGGSVDAAGATDTTDTTDTVEADVAVPRSPLADPVAPAPGAPEPVTPAPGTPAPVAADAALSISDVVAELAPRPAPALVTDQQLDASAWLDGINTIDDDLLPH